MGFCWQPGQANGTRANSPNFFSPLDRICPILNATIRGMKKEPEPQNQVDAAGPNPARIDPSMPQKITSPSTRSQSTIQFQEIPIGKFFEYRGRRYKKLALSMASDEDRNGNIFQAQTEVLPDPLPQPNLPSEVACCQSQPER
jgi:hypothetical protein